MVGFFARAATTDICIDADEIAYADWFTRDGLEAKLSSGQLALPGRSSIASRLIQAWRDGETPDALIDPDLIWADGACEAVRCRPALPTRNTDLFQAKHAARNFSRNNPGRRRTARRRDRS